MLNIDYNKFIKWWLYMFGNNNKSNIRRAKARVIDVEKDQTAAVVETIPDNIRIKLYNKSKEFLSIGDYVTIEYSKFLSTNTGYIYLRHGEPKPINRQEVLTQQEYDMLVANNQIENSKLYIIIE